MLRDLLSSTAAPHVIEMRERELDKTLHDVAALKTEYESKLAAIEAIVKGPVRSTE